MKKGITIYRAEAEAGLTDKIKTSTSLAYVSEVLADEAPATRVANYAVASEIAGNPKQEDLFYIKDVMVSAGIWNKNDDIFLKEYVWAARTSPEDKPLNLGHDSRSIIGHITAQYAVNSEGKAIADNSKLEDVPDHFDIINSTVIYKDCWTDPMYRNKIYKICAEIENREEKKKWGVSMECHFDDFDYAVYGGGLAIGEAGPISVSEINIIPRNEKTAFLTKHLRAFGGQGVYQGKRIGRVLKNISFAGKGLTENPANPTSDILESQNFSAVAENTVYPHSSNENKTEKTIMANEFETKIAELEKAKVEAEKQVAVLTSQVDKYKSDAEVSTKAVADLTEKVKGFETQLAKLAEEKTKVEASFKEVNDKLTVIETEKVKASRIENLVDKLSMEKAAATDLYNDALSGLSNEAFEKYVAKAPKVVVAKVEEKKEEKKLETAIAESKPGTEAPVSAPTDADKAIAGTQKAIADMLTSYVSSTKKNKTVAQTK